MGNPIQECLAFLRSTLWASPPRTTWAGWEGWMQRGTSEATATRFPPANARSSSEPAPHLVFVGVRQGFGCLSILWKVDVKPQDVSLSIARGIMFPYGLVKLGSLFAAPRVAELVIAQRGLEVPWGNKPFMVSTGREAGAPAKKCCVK